MPRDFCPVPKPNRRPKTEIGNAKTEFGQIANRSCGRFLLSRSSRVGVSSMDVDLRVERRQFPARGEKVAYPADALPGNVTGIPDRVPAQARVARPT